MMACNAASDAAVPDRRRALRRIGRALVTAVAGALCVAVFFRSEIANGFTLLLGDRLDGVIETTILEHWYNTLRGLAAYSKTKFFFPNSGGLGYNDGYFIYGCIYSAFRAAGFNPFLASEGVDIVLCAIGFFSFAWCVALLFRVRLFFRLLSASLFTLSPNLFLQVGHAQLLGVVFAPLLTALLYRAVAAAVEGRRGLATGFGVLAAVLHAAWLLSTFYMAWYCAFFGLWVAVVSLVRHRRRLGVAWALARRNALPLAVALASYLVALVPFLRIYLPKAAETGQHDFDGVSIFLPTPLDIVNLGPDNLLFGRLVDAVIQRLRPGFPACGECATGFAPLMLVLFVAALLWAFRGARRPEGQTCDAGRDLALVLGVAVLLSWLCVLKWGDVSLWALVYAVVPGAKAARVVARYQVFLSFPVVLLAGAFMQARYARLAPSALLVISTVLLLGQIEVVSDVALDAPGEAARLAALPPPPAGCRSFYVSRSREGVPDPGVTLGIYSHNVDAMLIAEVTGLPTINGFATFTPPQWNLVQPQEEERYAADVRRYIAANGLRDVCSLDLKTSAWSTAPPP